MDYKGLVQLRGQLLAAGLVALDYHHLVGEFLGFLCHHLGDAAAAQDGKALDAKIHFAGYASGKVDILFLGDDEHLVVETEAGLAVGDKGLVSSRYRHYPERRIVLVCYIFKDSLIDKRSVFLKPEDDELQFAVRELSELGSFGLFDELEYFGSSNLLGIEKKVYSKLGEEKLVLMAEVFGIVDTGRDFRGTHLFRQQG